MVEIVGRYVPLKKSGANYMGLCPFHSEKSPSFSVSPAKQFFHCFGCGRSGNAIGFLMEHAGMGFLEAVQDLAQQVGLQVPQEERSPQERAQAAAQRQQQATLTDLLERAAQAWQRQLGSAAQAIDYLKRRGLSPTIANHYGLGYAAASWHGLASVFPEYDSPQLVEAGLVILGEEGNKRYDRFRDRIMFPIRNVKGECIAFGGRVLGDDKPKYLNSPETPVFHKGRELYGLFEARQTIREKGYALVVEGYMDVVALAQLGFGNAVATLGTACTAEHVQKLLRFTDAVVFSFDGDSAGRRAARKALEAALPWASDTRSIKFLFLPPEHDPDSFIRTFGNESFAVQVGDAQPLSRFFIDTAREGCDQGTPEGRAHMLSNARPLWSEMPDGALKRQLFTQLAALGQIDVLGLSELWKQELPAHASKAIEPKNNEYKSWRRSNDWRGAKHGKGARIATQPPLQHQGQRRRDDHALRLLLSHMDFLEEIDHDDRAALASLPAPHGALFHWLEAQWLEHGARPWAQLQQDIHPHPLAEIALGVMTGSHAQAEGDMTELRTELRDLLTRMHIEHLKTEQNALIEHASEDPQALARYRQLQERRQTLEALCRS